MKREIKKMREQRVCKRGSRRRLKPSERIARGRQRLEPLHVGGVQDLVCVYWKNGEAAQQQAAGIRGGIGGRASA